jgi:thiamine-phosphate pyrophosphorylase
MSDTRITSARLYGFVDTAYLAGRDPGELAQAMIAGGVDLIQVRAKTESHPRRVELGLTVVQVARERAIPVIMNDDIEAAFESGADGVHLGQEDWASIPREDRTTRLAGMRIIGLSTHSLEQALQAERDGADYIGVGPIYPTGTKPGRPPVGVDLIQQVAGRVHVPFFAIGGITLDRLDEVISAGCSRVAVSSAIIAADNVVETTRKFKEKLKAAKA